MLDEELKASQDKVMKTLQDMHPDVSAFFYHLITRVSLLEEEIEKLKEPGTKASTMSRRDRLFATHIGKRGTK